MSLHISNPYASTHAGYMENESRLLLERQRGTNPCDWSSLATWLSPGHKGTNPCDWASFATWLSPECFHNRKHKRDQPLRLVIERDEESERSSDPSKLRPSQRSRDPLGRIPSMNWEESHVRLPPSREQRKHQQGLPGGPSHFVLDGILRCQVVTWSQKPITQSFKGMAK